MVVAEVLTGIALVKQATDFIKSNINTVNDIRDIGQQIDDLFRGEQECQKQRNKKSMSLADLTETNLCGELESKKVVLT